MAECSLWVAFDDDALEEGRSTPADCFEVTVVALLVTSCIVDGGCAAVTGFPSRTNWDC